MKEAVIAFVIALVLGSMLNNWNTNQSAPANQPPVNPQYSTNNQPATNAPAAPPILPSGVGDPDMEAALQKQAAAKVPPPAEYAIPVLDDAGFDRDVIKSASPVLVYFKAEGSVPCEKVESNVQQVAAQVQADVRVVSVDIMANPIIAEQYGAQEVPYFAVFKDGKKVDSASGELDKPGLIAFMKKTVPLAI